MNKYHNSQIIKMNAFQNLYVISTNRLHYYSVFAYIDGVSVAMPAYDD